MMKNIFIEKLVVGNDFYDKIFFYPIIYYEFLFMVAKFYIDLFATKISWLQFFFITNLYSKFIVIIFCNGNNHTLIL